MNLKSVMLAVLLCGVAAGAQARQNPAPKPSGKVVHLFGPNSLFGDVHPLAAMGSRPAHPAGAATANSTPGDGANAGRAEQAGSARMAAGAGTQTPMQPADASDPTMGDVLHQMFVTGDGTRHIPAPGRAADRAGDGPHGP